ncbi:MAG: GreA/GreB family elongation factor, partial [Oscillospiraceae bacterium]
RINEIEAMLQNVKILDEDALNTDIVNIGSKIKVKDIEYNDIMSYQIVGFAQADPEKGKISDEAPVGKALLGHTVGDTVEVEVPAGKLLFEIIEISK